MTTVNNKKCYPSEKYLNELITNIEFAARAPVEVVRAIAAELQKHRKAYANTAASKDGWISCSERMPNDKQYVWCWGKSYGWTECDTFEGYYDCSRNKWWAVTDNGEEPASKVTHWMPLPESPQEVK